MVFLAEKNKHNKRPWPKADATRGYPVNLSCPHRANVLCVFPDGPESVFVTVSRIRTSIGIVIRALRQDTH